MAEGFRVDGQKVDGFWMLSVRVTDPQAEQRVRVRGDMHVGGLMYKLVQELGECLLQPDTHGTSEYFVHRAHTEQTHMKREHP